MQAYELSVDDISVIYDLGYIAMLRKESKSIHQLVTDWHDPILIIRLARANVTAMMIMRAIFCTEEI